jgi:hypothetical protein
MFRKLLKLLGDFKDAEINHSLRESLEKNQAFRKIVIAIHESATKLKPKNLKSKKKKKDDEPLDIEITPKENKNEESKND